jgi:hypothetical protein
MKAVIRTALAVAALTTPWTVTASEQGGLSDHLAPLAPFVGKTWRGELGNSTPEKPVVDVARWERALNGKAVRVLHSINDGEYGGESLIVWDEARQSLVFYYFTTAGFYTQGTGRFEAGRLLTREAVTGSGAGAEGVTEVEAVFELLPDGRLRSTARYLKAGQWVPGHQVHYREDPAAKVVFR